MPGIVFLSGGQDDRVATVHLDAINRLPGTKPWKISFSYGRALQDHALETWHGRDENLAAVDKRCINAPVVTVRQVSAGTRMRWRTRRRASPVRCIAVDGATTDRGDAQG